MAHEYAARIQADIWTNSEWAWYWDVVGLAKLGQTVANYVMQVSFNRAGRKCKGIGGEEEKFRTKGSESVYLDQDVCFSQGRLKHH